DIRELHDNDTINVAKTGLKLNIRAEVSGKVDKVVFAFDRWDKFHTEETPPYYFVGDKDGKPNNWAPSLGEHTITVTAYRGEGKNQIQSAPLKISFWVVYFNTPGVNRKAPATRRK
ncbi:MAG: hypothetical protein D6820_04725, partial [Lentisphaerae bacterium]